MADTEGVDVGKGSEHLVGIELDEELGNALLHLDVMSHNSVDSLWDVIHDNVEIDLILLVPCGVEGMFHLYDVGVEQLFHDL